jgi:hypothetical protein
MKIIDIVIVNEIDLIYNSNYVSQMNKEIKGRQSEFNTLVDSLLCSATVAYTASYVIKTDGFFWFKDLT